MSSECAAVSVADVHGRCILSDYDKSGEQIEAIAQLQSYEAIVVQR